MKGMWDDIGALKAWLRAVGAGSVAKKRGAPKAEAGRITVTRDRDELIQTVVIKYPNGGTLIKLPGPVRRLTVNRDADGLIESVDIEDTDIEPWLGRGVHKWPQLSSL